MRKMIVLSMITLDGVIQGPGGPQEDPSGEFQFGGWCGAYKDDLYQSVVKKELEPAEYLLGRKTFEIWENYWPHHNDFWPGINSGMKYVLSNTRTDTDWQHTTFIQTVDDIKNLKSTDGADVHVWGCSELVHLLLKNDLVDELRLKIHPLILGAGKRLFDTESIATNYTLLESQVNTKGVIFTHYIRKEKQKPSV